MLLARAARAQIRRAQRSAALSTTAPTLPPSCVWRPCPFDDRSDAAPVVVVFGFTSSTQKQLESLREEMERVQATTGTASEEARRAAAEESRKCSAAASEADRVARAKDGALALVQEQLVAAQAKLRRRAADTW